MLYRSISQLVLLTAVLATASARADAATIQSPSSGSVTTLHDNGPIITEVAPGCGGVVRDLSVTRTSNSFGWFADSGDHIADDFSIVNSLGWHIEEIELLAFHVGIPAGTLITEVFLQIWNEDPRSGSGRVVWGDTTTNRLALRSTTGIYRVEDFIPDSCLHPIQRLVVDVGITLPPGRYWIDFTLGSGLLGARVPSVTIPGIAATGDALTCRYSNGACSSGWSPLVDGSDPQGIPFLVRGEIVRPPGRLIAVDSARALYSLDPATGTKTQIATVSSAAGTCGALAYDASRDALYLSSTSTDSLYTLDLFTGAATLVGPYGNSALVMHGLELDPQSGELYGASSHDNGLYRIDVRTGQATLVGTSGQTGFPNLLSDSRTGILYATSGGTDSLYRVDRSSGALTLVGPLSGPTNPQGLAYHLERSTAFLIDSTQDLLYRVDLNTGGATAIGSTGNGNLLGLAFVPWQPRIVRNAHGCGVAQLYVQGLTMPGGELTISVSNAPLALIGIGLTPLGLPFCNCTLGHEWGVSFPGNVHRIGLPRDPLLIGGTIAVQGLSAFATGGCPLPQITLTDTLLVTIE